MTVCGIEEAGRLLSLVGCEVRVHAASGDAVPARSLLLEAVADAEPILLGWKVSQTMVEWASGIATATRQLVHAAQSADPDAVVACTRKAVPGTRVLSAKAIVAGGAALHRTGLSDTILLFPEHSHLVEPALPLDRQIARLKAANPERNVVVEVKTSEDALSAAAAGADVLQLEKFEPATIVELIARLGRSGRPKIAAAGGIDAANAAAYAATGADILVTSAPYYARPADVEVVIGKV
jgi:molybdenum transport protein